MQAHNEAMEAVEAHPGAVEAHPGAVEIHTGAVEAHPGAVKARGVGTHAFIINFCKGIL
jgi:hypothetical protein